MRPIVPVAQLGRMPEACREWRGSLGRGGYGRRYSRSQGRAVYVHRWVWEQLHGPVPDGMVIAHRCHRPACFRLAHLVCVTQSENVAMSVAAQRWAGQKRTHCIHGHPFDEANTYIKPNGNRHCRACAWERRHR